MPCLSLKHIHNSRAISKNYRHHKKLAKKAISSQKANAKTAAKTAASAARAQAKQAAAAKRAAAKGLKNRKTAKAPKLFRPINRQNAQQSTQNSVSQQPRTSRITEESIRIPHHTPHRLPAHPSRADLINAESRLGSTIFGPIPEGHRREFFHDQENVWIWHEDWSDLTDGQQHPHQLTVRYEVRPSGVYKKVSAGSYFKLEGDELENFRRATHAYLHLIRTQLYNNPLRQA